MHDNPLQHLSEDVKLALLKAGWHPGKSRPRGDCRWEVEHKIAKQVLDELAGLEVIPAHLAGEYRPLRIVFRPAIAIGYEDEILELGRRLRIGLTPIANVGNGVAIMLLADSGHVLLLGYADRGVMIVGNTFGEAMRRTLRGELKRPIIFSDDPNNTFWNDQFAGDPTALRVGSEGLAILVNNP